MALYRRHGLVAKDELGPTKKAACKTEVSQAALMGRSQDFANRSLLANEAGLNDTTLAVQVCTWINNWSWRSWCNVT